MPTKVKTRTVDSWKAPTKVGTPDFAPEVVGLGDRGVATFREYRGNPLVEASGIAGDWREFAVSGPLVIIDPVDDCHYMLVRGFSEGRVGSGGIPQIGLFRSSDGLVWNEVSGNPIIARGGAGEFDENGVDCAGGTILWDRDSAKWRMYYWGVDGAGNTGRFGVAEANELTGPWTKSAANPIITCNADPIVGRFIAVFRRSRATPLWIAITQHNSNRLERWTSADGIAWVYDRDLIFAPPISLFPAETDKRNMPLYPQMPEVFTAHKLFGLFTLIYEAWGEMFPGQYYIGALASYDSIHWWQVPVPLYQDTGYGERGPYWYTIHPFIVLGKNGALLYHAHAYWHKDGGWVEWIETAFIDPKCLLDVLTNQGVYSVWDDEAVLADTNGYMYANKLNFGEATIAFKASVAGDLTVEVDPSGYGDWYLLYTRVAITEDLSKTTHDFTHLRMRFSEDADLTAKVVLKK